MLKFGKRTPLEVKERAEIIKRAEEEANNAILSAQICLRNPDFEKYRIEYENLGKLIMQQLILLDQTETDPVKYGFQAKDIVSKYRHIGALLRGVDSDAHRQVGE